MMLNDWYIWRISLKGNFFSLFLCNSFVRGWAAWTVSSICCIHTSCWAVSVCLRKPWRSYTDSRLTLWTFSVDVDSIICSKQGSCLHEVLHTPYGVKRQFSPIFLGLFWWRAAFIAHNFSPNWAAGGRDTDPVLSMLPPKINNQIHHVWGRHLLYTVCCVNDSQGRKTPVKSWQ